VTLAWVKKKKSCQKEIYNPVE